MLDLAVLAVLSKGESYGYNIVSQLEEAGLNGVGNASVYGTLRRLEEAGHLRSRLEVSASGPARKYYAVTDSGREMFGAGSLIWQRIARAVDALTGGRPA